MVLVEETRLLTCDVTLVEETGLLKCGVPLGEETGLMKCGVPLEEETGLLIYNAPLVEETGLLKYDVIYDETPLVDETGVLECNVPLIDEVDVPLKLLGKIDTEAIVLEVDDSVLANVFMSGMIASDQMQVEQGNKLVQLAQESVDSVLS